MKHLLTLTDLTKSDISNILELASQMRKIVTASGKKSPQLIGSIVAGVWDKPSVASTAFQLAAAYMSATACPVFGADDALQQCRALDNMGVNTVVASCKDDNALTSFAKTCHAGVINGGSLRNDPVGVLADLMALNYKNEGLSNLNVLLVGYRDANKVMELNHCLGLFGSNVVWYLPSDDITTPRNGVVIDSAYAAFSGADAVIDLGVEANYLSGKYYGASGGISEKLLDKARINCPLLGSRNVVDSMGVREYAHNIVSLRDSCYISVAMAVLYILQRD